MPPRLPVFPDYVLSLPERVVRSLTAIAGGFAREVGDFAVPGAIRRTLLYRTMVESTLRFLIEQVGQVEGAYPGEEALANNFLLRRTAGNGLEAIGILTFRASPVWVMAALADISGAGKHLIREIASSLQEEGLLDPGSTFETVEQMLDGLERTSTRVAEACNTPPLDVSSLRAELSAIRDEARRIPAPMLPTPESVAATWKSLQAEASVQGRSVFELSSAMALSAVTRLPENAWLLARSATSTARRAGGRLAGVLLDHYAQALDDMHQRGFTAYWTGALRPYMRAALGQFSPGRLSLTQRLLGRSGS